MWAQPWAGPVPVLPQAAPACRLLCSTEAALSPQAGPAPCRASNGSSGTSGGSVCRLPRRQSARKSQSVRHCLTVGLRHNLGHTVRQGPSQVQPQGGQPVARPASTGQVAGQLATDSQMDLVTPSHGCSHQGPQAPGHPASLSQSPPHSQTQRSIQSYSASPGHSPCESQPWSTCLLPTGESQPVSQSVKARSVCPPPAATQPSKPPCPVF